MTMPEERTRALRWAGEFLREVRKTEGVPEELKRQAWVILRHYPSTRDIEHQAKHGDDEMGVWLRPVFPTYGDS